MNVPAWFTQTFDNPAGALKRLDDVSREYRTALETPTPNRYTVVWLGREDNCGLAHAINRDRLFEIVGEVSDAEEIYVYDRHEGAVFVPEISWTLIPRK
jgi:hypothetical protein